MAARGEGFDLTDEWYSLKNFASNMHVLLVQETAGMTGAPYQRPAYPATWAKMHGTGRVFYTSMGHREDVWENPIFQDILFGGISWAVRNVNSRTAPNISKITPDCGTMPPKR
jgi:type 1 glutamine amidotransferase